MDACGAETNAGGTVGQKVNPPTRAKPCAVPCGYNRTDSASRSLAWSSRCQLIGESSCFSVANSCCANLLALRPETRIFKPVRQKLGFPRFAAR